VNQKNADSEIPLTSHPFQRLGINPSINSIEQVFAKLKCFLRKATERTIEATWKRIGALLDYFSSDECKSYSAIPDMS
jgi:hypothetical protein